MRPDIIVKRDNITPPSTLRELKPEHVSLAILVEQEVPKEVQAAQTPRVRKSRPFTLEHEPSRDSSESRHFPSPGQ
jgi:hypothetical protein